MNATIKKLILINFGEITLKKNNYDFFFKIILKNIKSKLKPFKDKIKYISYYYYLFLEIKQEDIFLKVFSDLKTIFGIYSISKVYKCKNNIKEICNTALYVINNKNIKTFKVECQRKNKDFIYNYYQVMQKVGAYLLKNANKNLSVSINNYDFLINIRIEKSYTIIYAKKELGLGGLPVGCSHNGLSLISGGIDSPVASFFALKKGINLKFIHFYIPPYTEEKTLNKIKQNLLNLKRYNNNNSFKLYIVNFTPLQNELNHIPNKSYRIIIMRRMFYRIAEIISIKNKYQSIITGESIGQVASQTIESIKTIENVLNKVIILRPLVTFDKLEIINIAKKIKTYETSIIPLKDTCALFVPKNPITKPYITKAIKQEKAIYWKEILDNIIKNNIKIIKI